MAGVVFNHMELSVPRGALEGALPQELSSFYGDVLGWTMGEPQFVGGRIQFRMRPTPDNFLLIAESDSPMSAPGYDHLGLLYDDRVEVERVFDEGERMHGSDERCEVWRYDDIYRDGIIIHGFYLRYLLPIWFDVQCIEPDPNASA